MSAASWFVAGLDVFGLELFMPCVCGDPCDSELFGDLCSCVALFEKFVAASSCFFA